MPTGLNCIGKTQDSVVLNREDYTYYVYALQFDLAIKEYLIYTITLGSRIKEKLEKKIIPTRIFYHKNLKENVMFLGVNSSFLHVRIRP